MSGNRVQTGTPIPGATIQIKGRTAVVSKEGGRFSFPMPSGRFVIQSVKKQGYVLNDPEVLTKQYSYSANPFYLVMETPSQQIDDRLAAESALLDNLRNQVKRREKEIKELERQNKISHEQYQQAMMELSALRRSNEALVAEMAERYAMIDYDQMDDFNRQLDELLLNGDLVRADSLLRSSVSDIDSYIAEIHQEQAVQEAEQADIDRQIENLSKSRKGTQVKMDHADKVCYGHFVKFVMENQPDSAALYIERRAGIDKKNAQFQFEAASYFQKRDLQDKASQYYDRTLQIARGLDVNGSNPNEPLLAHTLNNVALLNLQQRRGPDAASMFQEALSIYRRLSIDNPQLYQRYVASTLNNLALYYSGGNDGEKEKSEPLFTEALELYRAMADENATAFMPRVASVLNNLGILYDENGRYEDGERVYREALDIYRRLAAERTGIHDADVASTLNNLSTLLMHSGTAGVEPMAMLQQAVFIYRRLSDKDMGLYGNKLGAVLTNLAELYYNESQLTNGDNTLNQALDVFRSLVSSGYYSCRPMMAMKAYELGARYFNTGELEQCERLFKESVDTYRELAGQDPVTYLPLLARSLRNQAATLDQLHMWEDAGMCYQQELEINRELAHDDQERYSADVARSLGNLSSHYLYMGDFEKAISCGNEGLACDGKKLFIHANLALAHLCLGHTDMAHAIYDRYRDVLKESFLDDIQQLTTLGRIPPERGQDVADVVEFLTR